MSRSVITRSSLRRSGGGGIGTGQVDQIVPGTGISVSPAGGTGVVTVTNTGVTNIDGTSGAVGLFPAFLSGAQEPNGKAVNVAVTTGPGGSLDIQQYIQADWTIGLTRVYAIDPINGDDINIGFADAGSTSAGSYAAACVAAGAVAKKTIAGLTNVFPKVGAGRTVEIVIANGGVNTEGAFAETLGQLLSAVEGYGNGGPIVRGTGTNTTAGCVAFDGSVADVTYQGGITVPTLNVPGYNPNGATTTSLPCLKVGGAAAALPAEPASPLGWRVRFDAATTTVGLRNQCRMIAAVTGGTTITPATAFSGAPANGDVFYIEQAGVAITVADVITGFGQVAPGNAVLGFFSPQITGIRWNTTIGFSNVSVRYAFCGGGQFNFTGDTNYVNVNQLFGHPVLGSITCGGAFRAEASASSFSPLAGSGKFSGTGLVIGGTNLTLNQSTSVAWGSACFVSAVLAWTNCSLPSGFENGATPQIGSAGTSAVRTPRATRLAAANVRGQIGACVFAGAGASPAITLTGTCIIAFNNGVCAGTTGNNDVGLDLSLARGCLITLGSTLPTVTGALGDIRLAGGQIITWAQANATAIVDGAGNRIMSASGTGVCPAAISTYTAALFGAAGAALSYAANTTPGLLLVNEAVAVRYPTSQRLIVRMRVTVLALSTNTINNTVTLFKNGVATAMTVTIPAATAAFTKFADLTHPILFADADDLSIQIANAAGDLLAVTKVAIALEHTV